MAMIKPRCGHHCWLSCKLLRFLLLPYLLTSSAFLLDHVVCASQTFTLAQPVRVKLDDTSTGNTPGRLKGGSKAT